MIAREITPELAEVRTALRRFTTERLEPIATEIDRTGEIPQTAWDALRDQGYLGMRLPEEFGGGGFGLGDLLSRTRGVQPLAPRLHAAARRHERPDADRDRAHGDRRTEDEVPAEARRRQWKAAFALTEPGAGSDSAAIATRAERGDGGWVLNGRKHTSAAATTPTS